MSTEENKAAVRDFFTIADRDQSMTNAVEKHAALNYRGHFPGAPEMDREGFKGFGNLFYAACPGLSHSIEDLVGEGDVVGVRMVIRGTQSQPFNTPNGAIPASGKDFVLEAQNVCHFAGGKLVEHWVAFDMMGFLQQIGAMPS
jgi:predicted ester cyclase